MARPTDTGTNRTGVSAAPSRFDEMKDTMGSAAETPPGDQLQMAAVQRTYIEEGEVLGNVPPPDSLTGAVTAGKEKLKGNKPTAFVDKLGERLAFERTGVRLYDALLTKFDVLGSWEGGPSRSDLAEIRDEELAHFNLVKQSMERIGVDPTAMTPSADLVGIEGSGVLKAITDPRTTLPEALHAQLIAERADVDGWSLLIDLAEQAGQSSLAGEFREAREREELHAERVKNWVAGGVTADMAGELEHAQQQEETSA